MTPTTRENLLRLWREKPQFMPRRIWIPGMLAEPFANNFSSTDETSGKGYIMDEEKVELLAIGAIVKALGSLCLEDHDDGDERWRVGDYAQNDNFDTHGVGPTLLDALIAAAFASQKANA